MISYMYKIVKGFPSTELIYISIISLISMYLFWEHLNSALLKISGNQYSVINYSHHIIY